MLRRAKDYVTWGEIGGGTLIELLRERGRLIGERKLDGGFLKRLGCSQLKDLTSAIVAGKLSLSDLRREGLKSVFRLHPPKGGFKGSTKRAFEQEGESGYRGVAVEGLLLRMI